MPSFQNLVKSRQAYVELFDRILSQGNQALEGNDLTLLKSACETLHLLLLGVGRPVDEKVCIPMTQLTALIKRAVSRSTVIGQATSTEGLKLLISVVQIVRKGALPWAWPICDIVETSLRISESWPDVRCLAYKAADACALNMGVGVANRLFEHLASSVGMANLKRSFPTALLADVPVTLVVAARSKQKKSRVDAVPAMRTSVPTANGSSYFGQNPSLDKGLEQCNVACVKALASCIEIAGGFTQVELRGKVEQFLLFELAAVDMPHGLFENSPALRIQVVLALVALCKLTKDHTILRGSQRLFQSLARSRREQNTLVAQTAARAYFLIDSMVVERAMPNSRNKRIAINGPEVKRVKHTLKKSNVPATGDTTSSSVLSTSRGVGDTNGEQESKESEVDAEMEQAQIDVYAAQTVFAAGNLLEEDEDGDDDNVDNDDDSDIPDIV